MSTIDPLEVLIRDDKEGVLGNLLVSAFQLAWTRLEIGRKVDSIGSAQYRRILHHWITRELATLEASLERIAEAEFEREEKRFVEQEGVFLGDQPEED